MVVRLPLSNFSPPPHPPLFFSVPVLSVKCYDNITHSIQAVRDKSKVFFCVEHRGKVEVSQQHNLPFGSIRRNRFPFLLYSQHRNSGDLLRTYQPILSLNNISMCGYLFTREIITVTSEPASLMRNAFVSSLGLLSESNEYAILKDILPGSKM